MKKYGKRYFVVALMVMVTLLSSSLASAAPAQMSPQEIARQNQAILDVKMRITGLLQQITEKQAEALLPTHQGSVRMASNTTILDKFSQLKALGVTELTPSEVQARQAQSASNSATSSTALSPYVATPPSTSNVRWWSFKYTWTMNDGKQYDVQELYAQGLNGHSNLSSGADGAVLYNGANVIVNDSVVLLSIYAQKLVGMVPIVQWLPYELLFNPNVNVVNNSATITYRSLETVCFAYVKPHGKSDDYQKLSFSSNYVSIASTRVLAGYKKGVPYTKSSDSTQTAMADHYANAVSEIKAYLSPAYAQTRDYVEGFTFYNQNKSKSVSGSVPSFLYPGQVH